MEEFFATTNDNHLHRLTIKKIRWYQFWQLKDDSFCNYRQRVLDLWDLLDHNILSFHNVVLCVGKD